jgi:hypothetical protein
MLRRASEHFASCEQNVRRMFALPTECAGADSREEEHARIRLDFMLSDVELNTMTSLASEN